MNIRSFDGKKYSDIVSITVLVVIIDIEIDATDPDSVIPTESAKITVNLHNYGSIYDYITLEATNLPSGWELVDDNLTTRLSKYTSKNITLSIVAPQYYPEGDYLITIKGTSSRDSRENSFANVTVTILRYYDFDVVSSANQSDTPRNTMEVEFYITNQGNYRDRYELEAFLDKDWEYEIVGSDLTSLVDSSETITIVVEVTIPDKEYWQTTAQVQLNVTGGNYGTDDEFIKHNSTYVSVDLERRLSISVDSFQKYQLPEETISYDITIENTGNYQDNVSLDNNSLGDDWSQYLSTYSLNLGYLESKTFQLSVAIGEDAYVHDNFGSTVTAISEGDSDVEIDIGVTTYALQYASVDIVNPLDAIEEPYREVIFVFEVYNSGNGLDSFNITGSSSGNWIFEMDKEITIELDRFETDNVTVIVSVPAGTPVGTKDTFTITVDSLFSSTIVSSATSKITVKEGHGSVIEFVSGPEYLYPGTESNIKYKVTNIGNVPDGIIIDNLVLPAEWSGNFNDSLPFTLDLSAGEFEIIDFLLTPSSDYEHSRQAEYEWSIDLTSSKNISRTTTNNFSNEVGYVGSFDINISDGPYEDHPNDWVGIGFQIFNNGNSEDNLNLDYSSSDMWEYEVFNNDPYIDYASSGFTELDIRIPNDALVWDTMAVSFQFTSEKDSNLSYMFNLKFLFIQF